MTIAELIAQLARAQDTFGADTPVGMFDPTGVGEGWSPVDLGLLRAEREDGVMVVGLGLTSKSESFEISHGPLAV